MKVKGTSRLRECYVSSKAKKPNLYSDLLSDYFVFTYFTDGSVALLTARVDKLYDHTTTIVKLSLNKHVSLVT